MIRQEKCTVPVRVIKITVAYSRATAAVDMYGNRRFEMGAAPATVDELLRDLYEHEDVSYQTISGNGLFYTYLRGKPRSTHFSAPATNPGSWFRFEGEDWGLWSEFDAIQWVRFVRAPEHDDPERETLCIHLVSVNGGPSLRCCFNGLYDEQKRPVPARFARWEALRARYGGCDKLRVENGRLIPLAAGES
jgi:hypothetical protein